MIRNTGSKVGAQSNRDIKRVADAAARAALSPVNGELALQLDTDELYAYDATTSAWVLIKAGISSAITDVTKEPTGFVNTTDSTISFVNGTRTFTIQPAVTSFDYYIKGVKYTKSSAENLVISATEGVHYIYYDGSSLAEVTTFNNNLFSDYAVVLMLYWDNTNLKEIAFLDERHGLSMPFGTHIFLHNTFGAQLSSGGELGNISANDAVPNNASSQFSNALTVFYDEDVRHTNAARASSSNIAVYYRSGLDASNIWRINEAASYAGITTGSGRLAWNQLTGGSWQQTEVDSQKFVLSHVFTFNDPNRKFGIIQGQATYNSIAAARDGAEVEINSIVVNGLPTLEFKFLGTIILQTADGYTGSATKSRIVSTVDGSDYIDLRDFAIARSGLSVTVTDHNALSSLQGGTTNEYYHFTSAKYGYLNTITSDVQAQINGKQNDVITTQGDLVLGDGAGAESRLAIGSNGTILSSNGTTASWNNPSFIDHDALTNFVANEHIDWTSTSSNLSTSGTITTTDSTSGVIAKRIKTNNTASQSTAFVGSGLNDLSVDVSAYKGPSINIRARIVTVGATDTFTVYFGRSYNGPQLVSGQACSTSPTAIFQGITITFGAITGHTQYDYWDISITSQGVTFSNSDSSEVSTISGSGVFEGDEIFLGTNPYNDNLILANKNAGDWEIGNSYAIRQENDGTTHINAFDAKAIEFNQNGARKMRFYGNAFGIGVTFPAAKLHITQENSSGAVPVLELDQDDTDQPFVEFDGTSAADGSASVSSSTGEAGACGGKVRVTINGVTKWIRFYDDHT